MILIVLILHLLLLFKTQFTLWPEMVVYPYLMNNGFILYKDIINPYAPLFTYFLAFFSKFFGYEPFPYQVLTWLTVILTDLLIFYLVSKLTGDRVKSLISLIFFVVLSIPFSINGLWYDLVQTPFILLSIYAFLNFLKNPKEQGFLLQTVIYLTTAFFIKQQTSWLIIWFLFVFIYRFKENSLKIILQNKIVFLIPTIVLFAQILFFWQKGILGEFLYLSLYFPFLKASTMPGYILLPTIRQIIVVGSLVLLFVPILSKKAFENNFIIISALVLTLFAFPRFDYFHLIPSLAAISLLFGQNLFEMIKANNIMKVLIFFCASILSFSFLRFVKNHTLQEIRFYETSIIDSASFLKSISKKNDIVYIQNGPDQLLPLSDLLPTKPWAIQFPWYLEIEKFQSAVLVGIKSQNPKLIISKPYERGSKYQTGSYRPPQIAGYIDNNYKDFIQISDTLWLKIKK